MKKNTPSSNLDLHSEAAIADPYPLYKELRDCGGVVWMDRYDMWALSRYADVRAALANWEVFSSAQGVALNERMNGLVSGTTLRTDPPEHRELRSVLRRPLSAKALRELEAEIADEAEQLVTRLLDKGTFDAVSDLAEYLPQTIVSKYVGLPEEGRENMLKWAGAAFDCFGPAGKPRTEAGFSVVAEELEYLDRHAVPGQLRSDGWAQKLYDAAGDGEISVTACKAMLNDYVNPSLDTTISAISSAIMLFGQHADQWDLLRSEPELIPQAINEVVRLESPVTGFTRFVKEDHQVDGVTVPAGSRAMVLFASANRDERKWEDPDRFDIRRAGVAQQIGWGFGEHACVGMGLARLEMKVLLSALVTRVRKLELGEITREPNMVLRKLRRLEVTIS